MGAPMLAALRDASASAMGFDVAERASDWITQDAEAFVQELETLVIVVRDRVQTEDVLFGAQSFVARAPKLGRIILCSTLSPRYVRELRDRVPAHITMIDAPMSGAQISAEERSLTFILGGAVADIENAMPLLAAMGERFHHMGPFGSGMQAKVLNNLLAASNTAMTRLVLDWAQEAELDEDKLFEVISTSSGQNWFASGFDRIEFARDGHAADNTIGILVKDVAAAIDGAPDEAEMVLPQTVMTTLRNLKPRD